MPIEKVGPAVEPGAEQSQTQQGQFGGQIEKLPRGGALLDAPLSSIDPDAPAWAEAAGGPSSKSYMSRVLWKTFGDLDQHENFSKWYQGFTGRGAISFGPGKLLVEDKDGEWRALDSEASGSRETALDMLDLVGDFAFGAVTEAGGAIGAQLGSRLGMVGTSPTGPGAILGGGVGAGIGLGAGRVAVGGGSELMRQQAAVMMGMRREYDLTQAALIGGASGLAPMAASKVVRSARPAVAAVRAPLASVGQSMKEGALSMAANVARIAEQPGFTAWKALALRASTMLPAPRIPGPEAMVRGIRRSIAKVKSYGFKEQPELNAVIKTLDDRGERIDLTDIWNGFGRQAARIADDKASPQVDSLKKEMANFLGLEEVFSGGGAVPRVTPGARIDPISGRPIIAQGRQVAPSGIAPIDPAIAGVEGGASFGLMPKSESPGVLSSSGRIRVSPSVAWEVKKRIANLAADLRLHPESSGAAKEIGEELHTLSGSINNKFRTFKGKLPGGENIANAYRRLNTRLEDQSFANRNLEFLLGPGELNLKRMSGMAAREVADASGRLMNLYVHKESKLREGLKLWDKAFKSSTGKLFDWAFYELDPGMQTGLKALIKQRTLQRRLIGSPMKGELGIADVANLSGRVGLEGVPSSSPKVTMMGRPLGASLLGASIFTGSHLLGADLLTSGIASLGGTAGAFALSSPKAVVGATTNVQRATRALSSKSKPFRAGVARRVNQAGAAVGSDLGKAISNYFVSSTGRGIVRDTRSAKRKELDGD